MAQVMEIEAGALADLQATGMLTTKVGSTPVCVLWHDGQAWAVDDRCPHMGFPLHRGTTENGLLTCHWHHARFDLGSGGTLDPWADDVRAYRVRIDGDRVMVVVEPETDRPAHHRRRLVDGLEQGLTLVSAKAVLGLLDEGVPPGDIARVGIEFGTANREQGWSAGLTVLVAMTNVLSQLDAADRPLALVHGLAFVSRDTRGRPPRFPLGALANTDIGDERLRSWYRRCIETRAADGAERVLATAVQSGASLPALARVMTSAATDHVWLDEGHTLDFINKAFESLDHLGETAAADVLPTMVGPTARAMRHEEDGQWRHPIDLIELYETAVAKLPELSPGAWDDTAALARVILDEEQPAAIVDAIDAAVAGGATGEQLGRAVALAAGMRIARFHTQNDHGDWDVVHHAFTTANALHQLLVRSPSPELVRGVYQVALRVYLDRFLNVPAARIPVAPGGATLRDLDSCWDEQGRVDEAGAIVYAHVSGGAEPERGEAIAALGRALLAEDAQFHWFQIYEAAVRQARSWPAGSDEAAIILAGAARFLAAHTPTRRELPKIVRIATRLRRGEALFEEE